MAQDFGNSARLGAELAVKEMNEVGGYPGRPVELVMRDDKANRDEGRKVSEDLVLTEKVAFTIGFCNTGVAMKSLEVFQQNKHLLVEDIVKRGFTQIALLADKTGYGEGGFNDVLKFLGERNLKPVYVARFDLGVKTLAQEVQDARTAGADVIVGYTVGPEFAVGLRLGAFVPVCMVSTSEIGGQLHRDFGVNQDGRSPSRPCARAEPTIVCRPVQA